MIENHPNRPLPHFWGVLSFPFHDPILSTDRVSGKPGAIHLREFFALAPALSITTDRIRSYIVHRQKKGAAAASIQKELGHLKRAFNLAVQAERLTSRPHVPSIQVHNTREGFVEAVELEKLLGHLPAAVRPVVQFAYLTG